MKSSNGSPDNRFLIEVIAFTLSEEFTLEQDKWKTINVNLCRTMIHRQKSNIDNSNIYIFGIRQHYERI